MIDQNDLMASVRTILIGNATIAAVGVYYLRAPQQQAFPYLTFFPVTSVPLHTQGSGIVETTGVQIDIWSTSATTVHRLQTEAANELDAATLSLGTITGISIVRGNQLPVDVEQTEQAGPVIHQPMEYNFFVR